MDNWVNDIAKDMLDAPHLHITLTTDDLLRPFFYADRSLLKLLLRVAAQAVHEVLENTYPGVRFGMIHAASMPSAATSALNPIFTWFGYFRGSKHGDPQRVSHRR